MVEGEGGDGRKKVAPLGTATLERRLRPGGSTPCLPGGSLTIAGAFPPANRSKPMRSLALCALASLAAPTQLLAAPAPPSSLPAWTAPQDPAKLDQELAGYCEAAAKLPLERLWAQAEKVALLLGDEVGAPFDAAVDRALRSGKYTGKALLFLGATRLLGEEVDWELLSNSLLPLLKSDEDEVVSGATSLFGSSDLGRQEMELRRKVAAALLELAGDGDRPAALRADAAVAAHEIGDGTQVPKARAVLYEFLGSADPGLRARGALGMASLGIIEGVPAVETELERLATYPGEEGLLAKAYLRQQQIRRYKDTELRRAREHAQELVQGGAVAPDLQRVEQLITMIQRLHMDGDKVDREDLLEAAMDGMLHSLDRHSSYFSPEAYKKFEQDLEAEYGGIGAYVNTDPKDGLFTITRPIYSGPAYHAGLASDDKIVRVDDWPTVGKTDEEIIKHLKGKPGTLVKLYVWRRGMDAALIDRPTEDMAITVKRAAITIPPVNSLLLPGKIGLIELTSFSRVASQEVGKALDDLTAQGARAFILDLRNNPGGLLTEARNTADLFLPKGKRVVSTESRVNRPHVYSTQRPPRIPMDVPLVVLINRFSASASEIVSGALQDHGRAIIVGQRSYGKGSVQNLIPLDPESEDRYSDENGNHRHDDWEPLTLDRDGDGEFDYSPRIKLTIERYRLPTGRSIHRELDDEGNILSEGGIAPDVPVGPTRREQWRLMEMRRIQDTRLLRNWAREHYDEHRELFEELAEGDEGDWTRYPGFKELYESLDTALPEDDVRFLLRLELRRLVQDDRGAAFPYGSDYESDVQLQKAIEILLEKLGSKPDDYPAYAKTFDVVGEDGIVHGAPMHRDH